MATSLYMDGRKKWGRPQGMLFSDYEPVIDSGVLLPYGYEIGSETAGDNFLILSDDNRAPINISSNRIENKKRMINGRMRSYHIADKISISTSWTMLPSRSYSENPEFNSSGISPLAGFQNGQYTSDGGAGGVNLLDWYESHQGSFWIFLAYDKYNQFEDDDVDKYNRLGQYNQAVEVFFSDFSYTIEKRSGSTFDFWNINLSLEEV